MADNQNAQITVEQLLADVKAKGFDSVTALIQDRDRLVVERSSLETQVKEGTAKINAQGTELGDLRKKVTELDVLLKQATEGKGGSAGQQGTQGQAVQVDESKLTPEQRQLIDQKFNQLSDEQVTWVTASKENRAAFIAELITADPNVVKAGRPKSLFEKPLDGSSTPLDAIRKQLGLATKEKGAVPATPSRRGGFTTTAPGTTKQGEVRVTQKLPDGDVLGAIARGRASK